MLSGVISDYDTGTFYPQGRVKKGNGANIGDYHAWDAKAYQDIACEKVQRRGITRCQDCPLDISECPAWSR